MTVIWNLNGPIQVSSSLQSLYLVNHSFIDLFADKNDFSWETIQKNRNKYYQKQMASRVNTAVSETMSLITSALNMHMNIGQNLLIDSSTIFMSIERTSAASLANKIIDQVGGAQIRIPSTLTLITNDNTSISLRVRQKILLWLIALSVCCSSQRCNHLLLQIIRN